MSSEEFARFSETPTTIDRNKVKICFIDDEGYSSLDKLTALGYKNITVKYEFNDLEEFSDFDVIFCDIQGIGKNIYPKYQGYDVAVELKKKFPSCIVFIYTGKDLSQYPPLPNGIKYISKQTTMKDIVAILDNSCEYLWNPIVAWKMIENDLRSKNTPNKYIAYLEDRFFTSIANNRNEVSESYFSANLNTFNDVKYFITTAIAIVDIILRFQGR